MAWYYNPVFGENFEIGLVASLRRLPSLSAAMGRKFAFSLRNSQISKFRTREKRQKRHF